MAKVVYKYVPPIGLPGVPAAAIRDNRTDADSAAQDAAAKRERWWYESSYDLRHGLDVNEDNPETIPGDLLDELFKP
ncbi:MAG TPA: hypothetical protein VLI72_03935 [Methylibium sp.]|nr:hypothetical protein [Methylibium sp.]